MRGQCLLHRISRCGATVCAWRKGSLMLGVFYFGGAYRKSHVAKKIVYTCNSKTGREIEKSYQVWIGFSKFVVEFALVMVNGTHSFPRKCMRCNSKKAPKWIERERQVVYMLHSEFGSLTSLCVICESRWNLSTLGRLHSSALKLGLSDEDIWNPIPLYLVRKLPSSNGAVLYKCLLH